MLLVAGISLLLCLGCSAQDDDKKNNTVMVSSYLAPPFLMQYNDSEGVQYEGYIPDLLDELSRLTGKHYKLMVSAHPGSRLVNDTWIGVVGDVYHGKADMGAGAITETAERRRYVDFSTPFMSFGPVVILKRPEEQMLGLAERLGRLLSPLSESVWLMHGLAWLVTSVVLYVICHVNPYDWRHLMRDRQATLREGEAFTCLNTFWFTTSTMIWQGYTRGPRSMGGRIVTTLWWVYIAMFLIMYIASMTNYLRLGPAPQDTRNYNYIQNIEDLGRQDQIEYGVLSNGSSQSMLRNDKGLRRVYSSVMRSRSVLGSISEGVDRIRESADKPFAIVTESAMAKYYTMQRPCDLYMVGDLTTIGTYALVLPTGSSDVKKIDLSLLALRESGRLRMIENKWFSGECTNFIMDSAGASKMELPPFYVVDLGSFSGALIILGLGLILGALVTGVEIFVFKYAEAGEKSKERKPAPNSSSRAEHHGKSYHPAPSADMEPITDV